MRTEDLLNLGNYQKLDFVLIAGNASNVEGVAAPRRPTKEERRAGVGVKLTAEAAQTRTYRKPVLSHQDLAHALAGCKRMPTLAAFYHVRGDFSVYPELQRGLMLELSRLIQRKRWPTQVTKHDGSFGYYQGELAALVLDYDAHMPLFRDVPALFARCIGVTDDVWSKIVHYWYDDLSRVYERWIATARAHVGRQWLEDEKEDWWQSVLRSAEDAETTTLSSRMAFVQGWLEQWESQIPAAAAKVLRGALPARKERHEDVSA